MADAQWFANGVMVYETDETEYFVGEMQLCNDQAGEAPAEYPHQLYNTRDMTPLLQM